MHNSKTPRMPEIKCPEKLQQNEKKMPAYSNPKPPKPSN